MNFSLKRDWPLMAILAGVGASVQSSLSRADVVMMSLLVGVGIVVYRMGSDGSQAD